MAHSAKGDTGGTELKNIKNSIHTVIAITLYLCPFCNTRTTFEPLTGAGKHVA